MRDVPQYILIGGEILGEIQFEWDEEKEQLNIEKHGIDFTTAVLVFKDAMYLELFDEDHSTEEERFNIIGMVEEVLFVVYTERASKIRIISARLANKNEREMYFDSFLYFKGRH
ncbi:MAG: BrnT family toxin [Oscillospiraceae bacterium]|nr:BrnT family toxin [Candidatus Limimonas egerieequi]